MAIGQLLGQHVDRGIEQRAQAVGGALPALAATTTQLGDDVGVLQPPPQNRPPAHADRLRDLGVGFSGEDQLDGAELAVGELFVRGPEYRGEESARLRAGGGLAVAAE